MKSSLLSCLLNTNMNRPDNLRSPQFVVGPPWPNL